MHLKPEEPLFSIGQDNETPAARRTFYAYRLTKGRNHAMFRTATRVCLTAITVMAILGLAAGTAHAADLYWDGPNVGGTGNGASDGGAGTWSTSNANWDQGAGLVRVAWDNTNGANNNYSTDGPITRKTKTAATRSCRRKTNR